MKSLRIIVTLILIFVFLLQLGCFSYFDIQPKGDKNAKYLVEVGNGWLKDEYYCDKFEKIGNVYHLYSKQNELLFVIDIPTNYYFVAKLNKEKKQKINKE